MIRTLILALVMLAVATVPARARGGDGHGSHSGHGHHHGHHHHLSHFAGGLYGSFPYGYPCWWEEGRWVNQRYGDKYGNYTDVLEWVSGHWVCGY
jgi:hypothetical protein